MLLGVLVLLAAASLGSLAYRTSREIIERATVGRVGIAANARKEMLIQVLTQMRDRAAGLLKTASLGCDREEIWCLRRLLSDFVATEGVTAARLVYQEDRTITVGKDAAALASVTPPAGNQIAQFAFDSSGQPYYIVQVQDGDAALTLRCEMRVMNQIFLDRYGLGETGETFLTDAKGFFLTPPRYSVNPGENRPISGQAADLCLAGSGAELLAPGYRGVPVIHGFRSVPEIGGGCIMALIDQGEAFAPTSQLKTELASISMLLAVLAVACSLLLAQLVSRPMQRLSERARSLQAGDFDSPVPSEGPTEVRMFAQTFQSMARSLKETHSALQESSEQLRNVLESISEGFAAFDREWRCTYVNEKAAALSRIPREQLLGRKLWELFPESVDTTIYAQLQRAMEDRTPIHLEEHYAPYDAWFEVDAYPTKNGLAVFGRDVTERKRFNERLQQTQRLESLGVLAGGIAHDFNNLLTGIIGNASLALEELSPHHPARTSLQAMVTAGERAATLTRQLLAYAGKGRFVIQTLDLSALVREIGNLLQTSIPRTVHLRLELQDGLPCIEGDAAQIQQLIMNLVINGAEAIGENNNGTVTVATGLQDVDESYIQQTLAPTEISPGSYVTLEVHDTGCGMDEATASRIFDPFFTTKFTGRGLGLAAAMGIVRGHKGALKVYSTPGKGSSFKVLFPAVEGAPARPQAVASAKSLAGTGTILVLDDEEVVRQTAKAALESYGYTVLLAENGEEGVGLFRKLADQISLVLLDMTMPVMSGEEALRRLKSIRPDVPVILSSGYNEGEATRRFTGKGLAGFVQKPYTAAHLAEKVQAVLRH